MEPLSLSRERFLRYWSANMGVAFAESGGAPWLGFGYAEPEMLRMRQLAAALPGTATSIFFAVTVVAYIVLAALGIVLFMMPVLDWLYPDPSKLQPLVMVLILAVIAFFTLGFGLPLSMKLGAWLGDHFGGGTAATPAPGDAKLVEKVRFQLWRMIVIMVGTFIPGCMLFILYDIQAGPLVLALKLVCGLLTLASLASVVRTRRT